MDRDETIRALKAHPVRYGRLMGFTKLGAVHDVWLRTILFGQGDWTLQAFRGSYKTTTVSVALALQSILRPNIKCAFIRKTDTDVKEVMAQVRRMLCEPETKAISAAIWGRPVELVTSTHTELHTNLTDDPRGTMQLTGLGIGGSLTGKHFDVIFTDDIVNPKDRKSRAEREQTKQVYMELQNIRNRGGRIINTGTPWHVDDAFSLMPEPEKWDYLSMPDVISPEEAAEIRKRMTASLWAANYELRHIPSDDVIFSEPRTGAGIERVYHAACHVDAAYYGEDYTAFTVMAVHEGTYYVYGRLWRRHVDECMPAIMTDYRRLMLGRIYTETNADKGYSAKKLKELGASVVPYPENENKHVKIVTFLKEIWPNVVFVDGTNQGYIDQICDYTEDADHDDAPDSAASLARVILGKRRNEGYRPKLYG